MKVLSLLGYALCVVTATATQLKPALKGKISSDRIMYGTTGEQAVKPKPAIESRGAISSCTNAPLTRNCWSPGYTVADDFDVKWPTTGVTRYVCCFTVFAP